MTGEWRDMLERTEQEIHLDELHSDDQDLRLAGSHLSERLRPRSWPRVSVVIPTLNEACNISWVLGRLPHWIEEVILIDGRSEDNTVEVAGLACPDIVVVEEPRPGKGAALRAGFARARGDYVVMLDADGSMDPHEIETFVDQLDKGFDLVKGSRFILGGGSTDITLLRRLGNHGLRLSVNALYQARFSDLCYGFFAFRRSCLPMLRLRSDGFEIETEILVNALNANLIIGEVASLESSRLNGTSNLRTFRDGARVLRTLTSQRFRGSRKTAGVMKEGPGPDRAFLSRQGMLNRPESRHFDAGEMKEVLSLTPEVLSLTPEVLAG
ncbi:hypothetical protein BH20ACT21_BH20ACT21_03780 [soil metagenome]